MTNAELRRNSANLLRSSSLWGNAKSDSVLRSIRRTAGCAVKHALVKQRGGLRKRPSRAGETEAKLFRASGSFQLEKSPAAVFARSRASSEFGGAIKKERFGASRWLLRRPFLRY